MSGMMSGVFSIESLYIEQTNSMHEDHSLATIEVTNASATLF